MNYVRILLTKKIIIFNYLLLNNLFIFYYFLFEIELTMLSESKQRKETDSFIVYFYFFKNFNSLLLFVSLTKMNCLKITFSLII